MWILHGTGRESSAERRRRVTLAPPPERGLQQVLVQGSVPALTARALPMTRHLPAFSPFADAKKACEPYLAGAKELVRWPLPPDSPRPTPVPVTLSTRRSPSVTRARQCEKIAGEVGEVDLGAQYGKFGPGYGATAEFCKDQACC